MYTIEQVNKNIGKNVKLLRVAKELTQEQLAEAVGLERKSITAIETGRTFISCESLINFSNFFNVEPAFFFKQNFIEHTNKEIDLQKKIISMTAGRNEKELKKFYNILVASID